MTLRLTYEVTNDRSDLALLPGGSASPNHLVLGPRVARPLSCLQGGPGEEDFGEFSGSLV